MLNEFNESTVFVVDDDPNCRRILKKIAEQTGARAVAYASASEFLDNYDPQAVGCLLLDVEMPEMSGLELQQRLRNLSFELPIIFVSSRIDLPTVSKAFRAGALDYLDKQNIHELLPARIAEALNMEVFKRTEGEAKAEVADRLDQLTPREKDVLNLIVNGKSLKQIAAHFNFSFQSAARHRTNILEKMAVDNGVELTNLLSSSGLQV